MKKIVSCLLTMLTAVTVLCACGTGSSVTTADNAQSSAAETAADSVRETTPEATTETARQTAASTTVITTTAATTTTACEHDWEPADCQHPETCRKCGETRGSAASHAWADATCSQPRTCRVCGETSGLPRAHSYSSATCIKARTCQYCGATEGEPLGHRWKDATFEAPKTCSRCGATEGKKLSVSDNWKGKVGTVVPQTFSFTNSRGERESEIKITSVKIDFEGSNYRDTGKMIITFAGTKTYDINGDRQSRSGKIGIKVYDSDGNVWGEKTFYTPSMKNGETFKDKDVTFYDVPHGSYIVKLLDTNTG